jgi:hypothetical protein
MQVIGTLNHLARWTRPDLATAVSFASRNASNPSKNDFEAIAKILGYLESTRDLRLVLNGKNISTVNLYTDSDWAGDQTDFKSQSGILVFLGANLISWKSQKQKCVAKSTMEAEYVAMSDGASEGSWIKQMAYDFELIAEENPITLRCDNQAAIAAVNNPTDHSRAKHINVKYHHIRDMMAKGEIELVYLPSSENPADIMTKGLERVKHMKHATFMGLSPWGSVANSMSNNVP